ncbi:MAG TPA: hypothetical protein VF735_08845 [Pyrinomonadaceae bacterium]|jgi:hypothetical protein
MGETNSNNMSLDDSLKRAQLKKIRLEIKQLKKGNGWGEAITQFIPLISVLIAVGGFLFGIYEFQKKSKVEQDKMLFEQQKDRETREADQTIRIQGQIRSDLEQLFNFTQDKQQTISKVLFTLGDLKAYLEIEKTLKQSGSNSYKTRDITTNLIKSVIDDCDFDVHRDVKYDRALMNHWEDSRPYLRENTGMNEYILYKYSEALRKIYNIDPSVVSSLKYTGQRFDYPDGYRKLSSPQIRHLEEIITSFNEHMQLFEADDVKKHYQKKFQVATCNSTLTEQIFGVKFDPSGDRELERCPNTK